MCGNITEQLLKDVSNSAAVLRQLDQSTDTAQLLVSIWIIFFKFQRQRITT
jgi:hypothetical protein